MSIFKSRLDNTVVEIQTDSSKKYGLLLSGGLDSAILLYLLIRNTPTIDLSIFTIPKHDGAEVHSLKIVNHFNKKFNLSLTPPKLVGNPNIYHRLQSTIAVKEIFLNYNIDLLYIGINQNPPELNNLDGAPKRSKGSNDTKISFPFLNLFKTHILDFIYEYDQEDLIEITHSCTEIKVGRCNRCWQCTERSWAFKQLNKIDSGTN